MVSKRDLRKPSQRRAPDRYSPEPAPIQKKINATHRARWRRAQKEAAEIKSKGKKAAKKTPSILSESSVSLVDTPTRSNNEPDLKKTKGGRVAKSQPKKAAATRKGAQPKRQSKPKAKPVAEKKILQAAEPVAKRQTPAAKPAPKKQKAAPKQAPKKQAAAPNPALKPKANSNAASKPAANKIKGGHITKTKASTPKPATQRKARSVIGTSSSSSVPLAELGEIVRPGSKARSVTPQTIKGGKARSRSGDSDIPLALEAARRGLPSVARSVVQGGQALVGTVTDVAVATTSTASPGKRIKRESLRTEKRWFDVGARQQSDSSSDE